MCPPGKKKDGIPDRWLDYTPVGKRLSGTRFIAFKVPLKQSLNRRLGSSDVFGPWDLLDTLRTDNQELGLIIDLTFTTRYYTLLDLPESLLYVKIFTAGHQVPSDGTILSFKRTVSRFLRDNVDNDKLIGVHCTHGLNRTGYLICRYLIDVDGMDPGEAVDLFNSSRGHNIERQNYLGDLHSGPKRSNEGMEESEQEPQRGGAARRPSYNLADSDSRVETPGGDYWDHRSFPPRGVNHRSHHHPPLLPNPPSFRPAPFHPYRWTPPPSAGQWRKPLHSGRPPPPELQWRPMRRRFPPPSLPCYSPPWASRSSSSSCEGREEEWRLHLGHMHRYTHGANGYDHN